jgi:hypothetical protein
LAGRFAEFADQPEKPRRFAEFAGEVGAAEPSALTTGLRPYTYGLQKLGSRTYDQMANLTDWLSKTQYGSLSSAGSYVANKLRGLRDASMPTDTLRGLIPNVIAGGIEGGGEIVKMMVAGPGAALPMAAILGWMNAPPERPWEAVGGAVSGALTVGAMQGLSALPRAVRVLTGAGTFGGLTAAGGAPAEDVAREAIIGGLLGLPGGRGGTVKEALSGEYRNPYAGMRESPEIISDRNTLLGNNARQEPTSVSSEPAGTTTPPVVSPVERILTKLEQRYSPDQGQAQTGQVTEVFYHATNESAAQSIMSGGFKGSDRAGGITSGEGVYLSPDIESTTYKRGGGQETNTLISARVNGAIYDTGIYGRKKGPSPFVKPDQWAAHQLEPDLPNSVILNNPREVLTRHGYKGVSWEFIEGGKSRRGLVVFDPKDVVPLESHPLATRAVAANKTPIRETLPGPSEKAAPIVPPAEPPVPKMSTVVPEKSTTPIKPPAPEYKVGQKVYIQLPKHRKPKIAHIQNIMLDESGKPMKVDVDYGGVTADTRFLGKQKKVTMRATVNPEDITIPASTIKIREYHEALSKAPIEDRPKIKADAKKFDDLANDHAAQFMTAEELATQEKAASKDVDGSRYFGQKAQAIQIYQGRKEARAKMAEQLGIEDIDNPVVRAKALPLLEKHLYDNPPTGGEVAVSALELKPGDRVKMLGEWYDVEPSETPGGLKLKDGITLDIQNPSDPAWSLQDVEAVKRGGDLPKFEKTPAEPSVLKKSPTSVKPPEPSAAAGEPRTESKLAIRAEIDAIEAKLTEDFGDLPEYKTMNMKDQASRAQELLDADYYQAKRMAMGEEAPPTGVREATVFEAVKIRALKEGDVETLRQLATESTVPGKLTEYGQAIKAADSKLLEDPVKVMQDVAKTRTELGQKIGTKKVSPAEIERLRTELETTKKAYDELIAKKAAKRQPINYGAKNKIVTTEKYQAALAELKQLTASTQLSAGVDPKSLPILAKLGTYHFEAGVREFGRWSIRMVEDAGEWIKPHLPALWIETKNDRQQVISLKSQKTRYANEIKKLNERLNNLDFAKTEKRIIQTDAEARKLKQEYDRARENYKSAADAAGVVTKGEAAQIVRLSQTTADARSVWESKLKEHDVDLDQYLKSNPREKAEYGAARVVYENYVNDLKGANASIKTLLKNRKGEFKTTWADNGPKAVADVGLDVLKTMADNSVSMAAAFDDSFLGRQGLHTLQAHPTVWRDMAGNSFADIVKTLGGKDAHDALMADVYSRPRYMNGEYQKAGLLPKTEEQYPTSLPARVPGIGRVYRAAEYAFTGSAIRARLGIYDLLANRAKENGAIWNDVQIKDVGKMINAMTARGQWGKTGEPALVRLVMWAPKMLKGNLDFITMHTADLALGGEGLKTAFARKEAAENLLKAVAETATLMMIANALKPGSAEYDPQSSDFGKIKVGDTRYDITGGAGSIVVLAARMATGASKNATTGEVTPYGFHYGQRSPFDALSDFLVNKENPPARVITSWLKGKDFSGEKFSWGKAIYGAYTPIPLQQVISLKDNSSADAVAGVMLDGFGISSNTYTNDERLFKGKLRRQYLEGDGQPIIDAYRNGKLTKTEAKALMSDKTPQEKAFGLLSIEEAMQTYNEATDDERQIFKRTMIGKIKAWAKSASPEDRARLSPTVKEFYRAMTGKGQQDQQRVGP